MFVSCKTFKLCESLLSFLGTIVAKVAMQNYHRLCRIVQGRDLFAVRSHNIIAYTCGLALQKEMKLNKYVWNLVTVFLK